MSSAHRKYVLINVPRLDLPGGVSNFYRQLRHHLGQDKRYFEVGTKSHESGGLGSVSRVIVDWWRFHRKLSSGNYSLVHLNPSLGSKAVLRDGVFLLIARLHSVPVLAFFHGWEPKVESLIERRYSIPFKLVFARSSGLVVLAESFHRQLRKIGLRVPIFQMTTCVDDAVFLRQLRPKEPKRRINVLYLGRLDHGKGVIEAVHSFAILKRQIPDATLTLAGDGPERAVAEQLVTQLSVDDVLFLGHVEADAKARAYAEADIYLFTSASEGMPTTVLEAMAYGLPVVTSSVGGLKDFFEHERMGFITESRDPDDLAGFLEKLARDPDLRRRIGHYNRKFAGENFAASKVAERLQDICTQVIASANQTGGELAYSKPQQSKTR